MSNVVGTMWIRSGNHYKLKPALLCPAPIFNNFDFISQKDTATFNWSMKIIFDEQNIQLKKEKRKNEDNKLTVETSIIATKKPNS